MKEKSHQKASLLTLLIAVSIVISLILASWRVLHGDVVFHTDIARDMSLLFNIVATKKLTLVGERVGGIPGFFHGPAWLYINLPAFVIGQGNPVVVGWGWILFCVLYIYSIYWVGLKMFNRKAGIVAAAIASSRLPLISAQMMNPNGAFFLLPLFYYTTWKYLSGKNIKYLLVSSFIAGMFIQFEIVFGLPMLFFLAFAVIWQILKKQKPLVHALGLLGVLPPLSTYLIFELRHGFVLTRTLQNYLMGSHAGIGFIVIVIDRLVVATQSLGILFGGASIFFVITSILFFGCLIYGFRKKETKHPIQFFVALYAFYWIFSLLLPETIKGYYYDFSSLTILLLSTVMVLYGGRLGKGVLVLLLIFNMVQAKSFVINATKEAGKVESSWIFNKELGEKIVKEAPSTFATFTLDTDIWGYSPRYGIEYAAKMAKKTMLSTKQPTTYLVIAKSTINHPLFDVRWWREDQIRITKTPTKVWDYKDVIRVEEYQLTESETSIPEDPNLMSTNTTLR